VATGPEEARPARVLIIEQYRAVFRAPGSLQFCLAGVVMRLPIARYPLGLVLLVAVRTGRYGAAASLSAEWRTGTARTTPIGAGLFVAVAATALALRLRRRVAVP
jgi:hypothetical protein